jgi:hypothetical protein
MDSESKLVPGGHAGLAERNSIIGTRQCCQTPPAKDEAYRPIEPQSVLGGECQLFVGALQQ